MKKINKKKKAQTLVFKKKIKGVGLFVLQEHNPGFRQMIEESTDYKTTYVLLAKEEIK